MAEPAQDAKVSLGDRLRKLMEDRGVSQVDLAKKTGLDRADLNRLINNKRAPRAEEIRLIAQVFAMPQIELVAGVELPPGVEKGVELIVELEATALAEKQKAELIQARLVALEQTIEAERKTIDAERTANLQGKYNMAQEHRAELSAMRAAHQNELVEVRRKHSAHVDDMNSSHELQTMQLYQDLQARDSEIQRLGAMIAQRDGALAMFDHHNTTLRKQLSAQSNSAGASAFFGGLAGLVIGAGLGSAGSSSRRR